MSLKRRVFDLAFSLAGGAVVTILVSWVIALQADPQLVTNPASGGTRAVENAPWPSKVPQGWPERSRFCSQFVTPTAFGGMRQWFAWGNHLGNYQGNYKACVTRAGWPFLAMESRLFVGDPGAWTTIRNGVYGNDGTFNAGLRVPLHWTRPHFNREEGWCSRRLPLRPRLPGFAINTIFFGSVLLGLSHLWRLHRVKFPTPLWMHLAGVLMLAAGINVVLALGLWCRWQWAMKPRELQGKTFGSDAAILWGWQARWPCAMPADWPTVPKWIGWRGEAHGVRAYEFTTHGIPTAAWGWLHVSWGPEALDRHQSVNVVQAGWPLPTLQSEELIVVSGWKANGSGMNLGPVVRRAALWNVTLPGAPASTRESDPAPFIPLRPVLPGMVVNTLVIGALIASARWSCSAVVVARRRSRGQCIRCGYEVKDLPRCPECAEVVGPSNHHAAASSL